MFHSQSCFEKGLGQTSPWLTPYAKHSPSGLSWGLCALKDLHVLSSQISGHAEHSPWVYVAGKTILVGTTHPEHHFRQLELKATHRC